MKLLRSRRIPARFARSASRTVAVAALAAFLTLASTALARPLVVIDAGHGGPYNSARYGSLLEKQANLLIALELGQQLYAAGYDVSFTRTADTAVTYADIPTWHWLADRWVYAPDGVAWYSDGVPRDDLQARCDAANSLGADVFLSVHCNGAASSAARGTENWASPHDALGMQLGQYVQAAVLEQTGQRDRGAGVTDFYVLRWTNMPALLIETGFMSNAVEGRAIADPSWRRAYVRGVVNGLNRWMATNPIRPTHPRYAGAGWSETAVIASRTQWPSGASTVLLGHTSDTASALAAPLATARLGAPLLFADLRGLTPATRAELARLRPTRIIAFGAEIADSVLADAAAAAGIDPSAVTRIAGVEPMSAAPLVSELLIGTTGPVTLVFASGANTSDALAAATLAAARGSALILARPDGSVPPEAAAYLAANSSRIDGVTTVGSVPDGGLRGLPNRARISSADSYQTLGAVVSTARPSGGLWLYCFNPLDAVDGLTAVSAAANRLGGVPVPIAGTYLSPYTREWLENAGSRVLAITMVGSYTSLPAAADHYVTKAVN